MAINVSTVCLYFRPGRTALQLSREVQCTWCATRRMGYIAHTYVAASCRGTLPAACCTLLLQYTIFRNFIKQLKAIRANKKRMASAQAACCSSSSLLSFHIFVVIVARDVVLLLHIMVCHLHFALPHSNTDMLHSSASE